MYKSGVGPLKKGGTHQKKWKNRIWTHNYLERGLPYDYVSQGLYPLSSGGGHGFHPHWMDALLVRS